MSKRTKFLLVGILTGLLMWFALQMPVDYRFGVLMALSVVVYVLSVWVLFEDLKGIEWITLITLPVMFTLGSGLFANFLPAAFPSILGKSFSLEVSLLIASVIKGVYMLLISVGVYGILLIENIFSVASIRTIQLLRAARSVNFIFTLVTAIFFYTVVFSLRLPFWFVSPIVFIVSLILCFPCLWSVDLKNNDLKIISRYALVVSWMVSVVASVLCFWPVRAFMGGLLVASIFYYSLGVLEQRMSRRVYLEGLIEYGVFTVIILLISFFTTSWLG